MSWDWATTVTGAVGIAGIAGTYWGARHQSEVAVRLAREERAQTRLERAYLELQRVVQRNEAWVEATMPMMNVSGADNHPMPPDNDSQVEASALRFYWSPKVAELVTVWAKARNTLALESSVASLNKQLAGDIWQRSPELKKAVHEAADALLDQMSAELRAVSTR